MLQMKSACCTLHHREHVGQKRRAYVHDQVGGWGGRRTIYPRPRQVKSCHVTTPLSPTCAAALQKILTKQSKHMYMYLLTKLSASQPATRHVCFRIHHTVYIHHKHNFQREARGAAVEERKKPPARGTPHTEDRLVRSRKVYS
jgi:hypothetical protein